MPSCSIAFMLGKSISRINLVKLPHYMVSGDLGYDGSAGNGETQFVTSGYSSLRDGTLRQGDPVNKEEVRLSGQFFYRLHHSQSGGLEDINGVNHLGRNDADADSHGFPANQLEESFTFSGVQFLAISHQFKPGQLGGVGQDNGAGYYRAGQGPPPDFVYAGDKLIALRLELVFVIKVRKLR